MGQRFPIAETTAAQAWPWIAARHPTCEPPAEAMRTIGAARRSHRQPPSPRPLAPRCGAGFEAGERDQAGFEAGERDRAGFEAGEESEVIMSVNPRRSGVRPSEPRIVRVVIGAWLFISAFPWLHGAFAWPHRAFAWPRREVEKGSPWFLGIVRTLAALAAQIAARPRREYAPCNMALYPRMGSPERKPRDNLETARCSRSSSHCSFRSRAALSTWVIFRPVFVPVASSFDLTSNLTEQPDRAT
jgi:hypothetical protein